MTMKDLSNGPDWIVWAVFALLVVLSAVLLSGHGTNLIAGYNTSSKEEKDKYDVKKLCRVVGGGLLAIASLLPFAVLGEALLPAWVAYAYLAFVIVDCIVMIILANTICKK
ncbi:MAG: DUF3784 domain-containing protein [Lachnospiraceae bacterium]|nr:DUF3784 domain-containing protein [Candidatus Equihabitans merdae]